MLRAGLREVVGKRLVMRPHVGPASLCSAGTNGAVGNGPAGRATGGADWCVPGVQTGVYPSTQPVSPARATPGAALWAHQDLLPSLMDVSHTQPVPRSGFVTGAVWGQRRLPLAVPPFPSHAPLSVPCPPRTRCPLQAELAARPLFFRFCCHQLERSFLSQPGFQGRGLRVRDGHPQHPRGFVPRGHIAAPRLAAPSVLMGFAGS